MKISNKDIYLYEGSGNRLLVVNLQHNFSYSDSELRHQLKELGLSYGADSVLVLTGSPENLATQGYHVTMDVFEPRGTDTQNSNVPGSWSIMCGNGVRVIARYLVDRGFSTCLIKTRNGIRPVDILTNNQFRVCMGKFTTRRTNLKKHVSNFKFQNLIHKNFNPTIKEIVIGLNGDFKDEGVIDGEPHLMIFDDSKYNLSDLVNLINKLGPLISPNREFFPEGINTNLVSIQNRNGRMLEVIACTFERGVWYVTQSCGTGATAIGSYLLSRNRNLSEIIVHMPGGTLKVERAPRKQFFLTGPANPLPLEL